MARFNMTLPHTLTQEEALRRIRGEIERLKTQYADKIGSLREGWNNHTYSFEVMAMGFKIPGAMIVRPFQVEIQADLPWLAMGIKGRIEATIRERMGSLLA